MEFACLIIPLVRNMTEARNINLGMAKVFTIWIFPKRVDFSIAILLEFWITNRNYSDKIELPSFVPIIGEINT